MINKQKQKDKAINNYTLLRFYLMAGPFDFFPYIACINLPTAPERWTQALSEFKKFDLTNRVEQVYANPPPVGITIPNLNFAKGNVGANCSHLKALVHALASGQRSCLIFEDDFYFTKETNELYYAINELPDDWDVLFLGGNPTDQMTKYSPNLFKPTKMLGAFSYAVNKRFLPTLIDRAIDKLAERPFDTVLSNCCTDSNVFAVTIPICRTRPGFSGVRGAFRSYEDAISTNWKEFSPK